jgi:DNA-binding beta-propeller fold protein YncE
MKIKQLFLLLLILCLAGCGSSGSSQNVTDDSGQLPLFTNVASMIVASLDGTVSIISTETDTVTHTLTLPPANNPPAAAYVVYSPVSNRIYVGDTANARVVVYSGSDLEQVAILNTDSDAFHMWPNGNQLWVVDRTAFSAIVFDVNTHERIATVAIPADLQQAGGIPHDVTADATHAFVTVLGLPGADVVVKYDKSTFAEAGRALVGEDPHVAINPASSGLYAACEGTDNVFFIDRDTMTIQSQVPAPGAHGTWVPPLGQTLYTTNFPGRDDNGSIPGLIAVDLVNEQVLGNAPPPAPRPHNVFGTADGSKAYVTHTDGGTTVSVYTIASPTAVPQFSTVVTVGQDPFGIALFPGAQ